MNKIGFDQYATLYDEWFMKNENVLNSEVELVAHFLPQCGDILSVGCGSGLFEQILSNHFNIHITHGIEPSASMAEIARNRGVDVVVGTAENTDFGVNCFDTVLFNGTPSYISDLQKAFDKAYSALRSGGRIVVIDVPKESSYGIMYNLALALGSWDHPLLAGVYPQDPYPIEFVKLAAWRTTAEKIEMLHCAGFEELRFAQTLTKHPLYSNKKTEYPTEGCDAGDYVAICALKK